MIGLPIFAPLSMNNPKNDHMNVSMKWFFSCLLLSICCLPAQAQNNSLGKNDPDAKKVLDALSARLKSFKTVQANFTLKVEDAKGKLQGSKSGSVYIRGNQYHISITGQEVYS